MRKHRIEEFTGGWFIGDFNPTLLKTSEFEVSYKIHKKGEIWPRHYHKMATEYNCLVFGEMAINGVVFTSGDIFIIEPGEVAHAEFVQDCHMIVVKAPSVIGDKYEA